MNKRIDENKKVTLTLKQLKNLVKEGMHGQFTWSIDEVDENGESLGCIEDSLTSEDATEPYFSSPEEAFEDGLEVLRQYDGDYVLAVSSNIADSRYEALARKVRAELHDLRIVRESHKSRRNPTINRQVSGI